MREVTNHRPCGLLSVPRLALLVVGAASILIGCDGQQPTSILLLSIDTLRADHLGCYGYKETTSPTIDALADEGVLFERVVANSPWTLPSHASMLTGLYPRSHGVRNHSSGLPEEIPTLAAVLRGAGYATMALVNTKYLSQRFGLHRGFEQFEYFPEQREKKRIRSAGDQVDLAIDWLSSTTDRPFFMFFHNYDVHADYDPAPEFRHLFTEGYEGNHAGTTAQLLRVRKGELKVSQEDLDHIVGLYDAGIRQLDTELSRLFAYLNESGLADHTVILLTSDHGEEFLDHGGVLHGRTMYREVLHVPLILAGPGIPSGKRIPDLAQLSDIFPTLMSIAGLESGSGIDGKSLVPVWTSSTSPAGRLAFSEADHNNAEDDTKSMVQSEVGKLIYDRFSGRGELYDLVADPGEHQDLGADNSSHHAHLRSALRRYLSAQRTGIELPPMEAETIETLQALGYL